MWSLLLGLLLSSTCFDVSLGGHTECVGSAVNGTLGFINSEWGECAGVLGETPQIFPAASDYHLVCLQHDASAEMIIDGEQCCPSPLAIQRG